MKTVCQENMCTGCFACADNCPKAAITIVDSMKAVNAVIDEDACISCGICEKVCQKLEVPEGRQPISWCQGWAKDPAVRSKSSSGGAAAAISLAFAEAGGVVCSCMFRDGEFRFDFAGTAEETMAFAGSKYVKSNPSGIYRQIRTMLKQGKKVLFIGLPCQVGALKKIVGSAEKLYTIDLVCHGTPSAKLLETYLLQQKKNLKEEKSIAFRIKQKKQVIVGGYGVSPIGVSDRYTIAFIHGLIFTENCYHCDYSGTNRVSDITLGDSYGSTLPDEQQQKGISLILCQTQKGRQLLEQAQLELHDVDLDTAVSRNEQLQHPFHKPDCREAFWSGLDAGEPINKLVSRAFPKACLRQNVKGLLVTLRGNGNEKVFE